LKDNCQSKKEDESKSDLIGSVEIVEHDNVDDGKIGKDVKETSSENNHEEDC